MMGGTYGAALMRSSHFLWCATLLLVFPGYGVASQGQSGEPIRVTFIDVGQADAILIRSPEGQIALVDAGRGEPLRSLGELGVEKIDLLGATHSHADHIGGMAGEPQTSASAVEGGGVADPTEGKEETAVGLERECMHPASRGAP